MKNYASSLFFAICMVMVLVAVPFIMAGEWVKKKVW